MRERERESRQKTTRGLEKETLTTLREEEEEDDDEIPPPTSHARRTHIHTHIPKEERIIHHKSFFVFGAKKKSNAFL